MKETELSGKSRVQELESLIQRYQDSYYNGEGEISDGEFDALWDELKKLDPDNLILKKVGADVTDGFPKARHIIPMGSQEKAANPQDFLAWAAKIKPAIFVVQHKLDGASLELQYEQGRLVRAVTRGDGFVGDDISANARRMAGVLDALDQDFSGGVRGEVVMPHEVWHGKYSDKANCRNAANGIMRRKDGLGCEDLRLVCYDAASSADDSFFSNEDEKIQWLGKQGFETALSVFFTSPQEVIAYREKVAAQRKSLPYDIDGLVVKDRDTNMADLRKARPERQIAFKFELESAVSILRDVEWSESGATYTPIGIIDPVRLAGTTVKRANLNNPGMIRNLKLRIGSSVVVVKRGEIIPKIEGLALRNESETEKPDELDISIPNRCESCGSTLVDGATRLYCPNPGCPKRLHHRIEKWISVLDIRELGDKLLSRLFESGKLRQVADLYKLTIGDILEQERMGELSAAKVLRHLRAPREISLAAFIAGFDLEGVGETIMEKLTGAGFDTLDKLRSASVEDLSKVHGFALITARTIADGLVETRPDMDAVLATGLIGIALPPAPHTQPFRGLSFCFTGELKSMKRSAAEERVKTLGGLVKASVVKDLAFLVTNDPQSGSSKNQKAQKLGVSIVGEDTFLRYLEHPSELVSATQKKSAGESTEDFAQDAKEQGELFGKEAF